MSVVSLVLLSIVSMVPNRIAHSDQKLADQKVQVVLADASGIRAGTEPRKARPTGRAYKPEVMAFFSRHDVRDSKGRIVTGVGLITWYEGAGVHVIVVTLVPKPSAPNVYMGSPTQVGMLQPDTLAEFTLARGSSRRLDEMKAL